MTTELVDKFYELYKNAGLIPTEIAINGILALVALMGVCFNSCLIYVTIKSKSLHSPCNFLVALCAFFASFLLIGSTSKFFVFLFGFNFISLRSCFFMQIAFCFGTSCAANLQLFIAIDRFFGVVFPLW
ncbi:hypothetical protein niasHT_008693 [Heterodera trifolii]|uniref:G-protein coupled receptors family 1 profile domain-containing protein n=1 Tax=Heterodera trifolii TaxID=157864 RepID=A0ABD2LTA4_9BILA